MIGRRWGHCMGLAVAVALTGCKPGGRQEEFLLAPPPPVLAKASLVSAPGNEPDRARSDAPPDEAAVGPVTVRATLSHSLYGKKSPKHLTLKVDLVATADRSKDRRPLNLALVFDRSGSMAEDQKFPFAMQAARLVIENLADRDVISLIVFNERAVVLSPAGRAVNKDFLHYRLGQFDPQGYTNLSAGLLEAFAQIDSESTAEQSKRVIVLTDGLANRGVTDPKKLRNLVAAATARGIGVSTLGCGMEFDEKLLTDLATAGGGRYTYVRSPEEIPAAITAELDGLLDVVAQNVRLEIGVATGGAITRVYGRLMNDRASSYPIALGDLRDGDQSVFLVEIAPEMFEPGAAVGVDVTLTLDNPETGMREQGRLHPDASFSNNKRRIQLSANSGVLAYANVLGAMEQAEEAVQGLDIERFREVSALFDRFYEDARKHAIEARDQQLLNQTFLLKHFMTELAAASEAGLMHDHREARRRLQKEVEYRRYLMDHHRGRQP